MDVSSQILKNRLEHCPYCDGIVIVGPASYPARDAPCPHCRALLWFVKKTVGDVTILTFLPGLIAGGESHSRIGEVTDAAGSTNRLVLNLSQLSFISSLFLSMLTGLHKRNIQSNGKLRLCGLQAQAKAAFTITKLDTIFDIDEDEHTSLKNL